jgi:hypothetical protein
MEEIGIGGLILISICVVLIILPPKYDPLIRWKERNERRKGRW